jgi:hypothetical protein
MAVGLVLRRDKPLNAAGKAPTCVGVDQTSAAARRLTQQRHNARVCVASGRATRLENIPLPVSQDRLEILGQCQHTD